MVETSGLVRVPTAHRGAAWGMKSWEAYTTGKLPSSSELLNTFHPKDTRYQHSWFRNHNLYINWTTWKSAPFVKSGEEITMRNGVQARGHFLECLLFIETGENSKQRPIKGVKGRLSLQNRGRRRCQSNRNSCKCLPKSGPQVLLPIPLDLTQLAITRNNKELTTGS